METDETQSLENIPHLAFAFLQPQLVQYFRGEQMSCVALPVRRRCRNKVIRHFHSWAGRRTREASPARPPFIKVAIWWEAPREKFLITDGPQLMMQGYHGDFRLPQEPFQTLVEAKKSNFGAAIRLIVVRN